MLVPSARTTKPLDRALPNGLSQGCGHVVFALATEFPVIMREALGRNAMNNCSDAYTGLHLTGGLEGLL